MKHTRSLRIFMLGLAVMLVVGCARSAPSALRPLAVEAVTVEVGVGSPIPVEIVASGTWPELCAQLAQTTMRIDGARIEVTLSATSAQPDCPPDYVGLPFRVAVPLNVVELPEGTYTVSVNGVTAEFVWPMP
jgi:hypothetical protein